MTRSLTAESGAALETLERLRTALVIAVVRAEDADEAVAVSEALAAGGFGAIELTFTTPGVDGALVEARKRLGATVLLGAGTITDSGQLEAAIAAGADFLVSPHLDVVLLEEMIATGLLAIPGVLTPSEVASAGHAGACAVKLFPASSVGIGHLKALFGPFPGLNVIPTGGISAANAGEWLSAGAVAVGMGGELYPKALVKARAWDEVTRCAKDLLGKLKGGEVA